MLLVFCPHIDMLENILNKIFKILSDSNDWMNYNTSSIPEKIILDLSFQGFSKEHILKGKFSQPFRTVLLDGYYVRNSKNITAYVKFNWDGTNPRLYTCKSEFFVWLNCLTEILLNVLNSLWYQSYIEIILNCNRGYLVIRMQFSS